MEQRGASLLFICLTAMACALQACAEGTLDRGDVTRLRDKPFPPLALTSNDPGGPDAASSDASVPLPSHPLATPALPADAGALADEQDAAASDAGGDAAPVNGDEQ